MSTGQARKHFDQSNREVVDTRSALERLHSQRQLGQNRDLEKAQARNRTAEERFASARQNFRLQEEALKSLQTKLYSQELPRIITVSFTLPPYHSFNNTFHSCPPSPSV